MILRPIIKIDIDARRIIDYKLVYNLITILILNHKKGAVKNFKNSLLITHLINN